MTVINGKMISWLLVTILCYLTTFARCQNEFLRNLSRINVLPCFFVVQYDTVGLFPPQTFENVPILPPVPVCPHPLAFIQMNIEIYTQDEPGIAKPFSALPCGQRLALVVHGYTPTANSSFSQMMKDSMIRKFPVVATVDWDRGSKNGEYPGSGTFIVEDAIIAGINLQIVGRRLAVILARLVQSECIDINDVYYYGHSFGAEMGHHVAVWLQTQYQLKMGTMFTIDPGAPFFYGHPERTLQPDDAVRTGCMHTTQYFQLFVPHTVGFIFPVAQQDFYPNGGGDRLIPQPGCLISPLAWCSHFKSIPYFDSSVDRCQFKTVKCPYLLNFERQNCTPSETQMGFHSTESSEQGIFYLKIPRNPYECEESQIADD